MQMIQGQLLQPGRMQASTSFSFYLFLGQEKIFSLAIICCPSANCTESCAPYKTVCELPVSPTVACNRMGLTNNRGISWFLYYSFVCLGWFC